MLTIGGLVAAGSVAYASTKVLSAANVDLQKLTGTLRVGRYGWVRKRLDKKLRRQTLITRLEQKPPAISVELQAANRAVGFSSIGLGMAAIGALSAPILLMATLPLSIYLFLPTFHAAFRAVRNERRITTPVLDATRITACIVMGYLFAAALNAWLESLGQRMLIRAKENFERTSSTHFGQRRDTVWLFQDGAEVEIPVVDLQPGMVITVTTGDAIPVGGSVLHGSAWVDEQLALGTDRPVHKAAGSLVYADTVIHQGQLFVLTGDLASGNSQAEVAEALQQAAQHKTFVQRFGEESGDSMAPLSLLLFGLSIPFWGTNRAAAFLTTDFGGQMRTLGPYLRHNFVELAARHQILIRDARAFEMANVVNTVIIDVDTVADPTNHAQVKEALHRLREQPWFLKQALPQPFAIYLLATGNKGSGEESAVQRLAAELGFDDYFVEPLTRAKVALLERLHAGGRIVCYVGNGVDDVVVMEKALVSISCQGAKTIATDQAQVLFLAPHPGQLHRFFALANQFAAKEGTSILWPLIMDFIGIGTTLFIHLGLIYSLLFNYSGFFASALNGRIPLSRHLRRNKATDSINAIIPSTSSSIHPTEL